MSSLHQRDGFETERPNPKSAELDTLAIADAFDVVNAEDATVAAAVARAKPAIVRAIEVASERLARGGAWVEFRTEDEQWAGSVLLRGGGEQTVVLRRSAQLTVHVAFEAEASRANWIVRLMRAPGLGAAGAYAAADVDEDGDAYVSGIDTTAVRAVELLKDGAVVRTVPLRLEPGDELTLEF